MIKVYKLVSFLFLCLQSRVKRILHSLFPLFGSFGKHLSIGVLLIKQELLRDNLIENPVKPSVASLPLKVHLLVDFVLDLFEILQFHFLPYLFDVDFEAHVSQLTRLRLL